LGGDPAVTNKACLCLCCSVGLHFSTCFTSITSPSCYIFCYLGRLFCCYLYCSLA